MEQPDPAPVIVRGHPTDTELAALFCALSTLPEPKAPIRPRVWPRTSRRSHSHLLHADLTTHPLEES